MRPKFKKSKELFPTVCSKVLPSHDHHVEQGVVCQDPNNTIKQWCPATITSFCDEKNCQSTWCEHMQPVKLAMIQSGHMWSVKPTVPYQVICGQCNQQCHKQVI